MSNARPEKVAGFVETHVVLRGTGSEHEGVVLTTDSGEQLRLQAWLRLEFRSRINFHTGCFKSSSETDVP